MRSGLKLVVIMAAVAAGAAHAQQPRPQGLPAKVVVPRGVAAAWDQYAIALERGDAKAAATLFTEDALAVDETGTGYSMRQSIENRMAKGLGAMKVLSLEIHPAEFRRMEMSAWEMGKYSEHVQEPGKAAQAVDCWYMAMWQQQGGNVWRISRLILSCKPPV